AGAGNDGGAIPDRPERDADQLEPLVVGEGRRLARGAGDDEPVRAVLDEVVRERGEAVEVDRSVRAERRGDRRQDFAEHSSHRTPAARKALVRALQPGEEESQNRRIWVTPARGFRRYPQNRGQG